MLRFVTRQRLLIGMLVVTSMGVGYALAQQPHMDAALRILEDARHELVQAAANKGGHRVRAIALVDQAIDQVRQGIAFAAANGVNITIAPPELPVYDQPPLPAAGYIWSPGYWAYGSDGYYWVPGTWVLPPAVGLLWTPGYWGWRDGFYRWNAGYWGPHVGFYGGVNYGFGYTGVGYLGGRWHSGVFAYNRTVNNFGSVRVTNVYNETVVNNVNVTRVSYNGGKGGLTAQSTPQEQAAAHERHIPPTGEQVQHQQMASSNKALLNSENHGRPTIAATVKPTAFTGRGVVAAREARPGSAPLGAKEHLGEPGPTGALPQNKGPAGPHPTTTLNSGVPRVTGAKPSVASPSRPQITTAPMPHGTMPHPPVRAAVAPHPMAAPHPPAHAAVAPHPMAAPHPPVRAAVAPHPMAAPHPPVRAAVAPHPMAAPHPPAPHPHPQPQHRPGQHPQKERKGG
jgi:hypothetical protein